MTEQELRRVLSQGPFTDLLDSLARHEVVLRALNGIAELKDDYVQQLLLRYFQYRIDDTKFGKPTLSQNGLETMKHLNREMSGSTGETFYKHDELIKPLLKSLNLIISVFNENEAFRRPVPIQQSGQPEKQLKKVWYNQTKLRDPIWDCTVATFAHPDILANEKLVLENADDIRKGLIDVMQTDPLFTDKLLSSKISNRVDLFRSKINSIINRSSEKQEKRIAMSYQQRKDLIRAAISSSSPCKLCGQSLGHYHEHLHIDHVIPVSKGGTNSLDNLQVVHKTCNLMKYNKMQ
jgi:5-methylcytosine-specific restriction endonuclease McrA